MHNTSYTCTNVRERIDRQRFQSMCVLLGYIQPELLLQNDDANYCSSIRTKKDRDAKGPVAQWLKEPQ